MVNLCYTDNRAPFDARALKYRRLKHRSGRKEWDAREKNK